MATLLLENGAHVNARDLERRTPLKLAEEWHMEKMVQLLLKNGTGAQYIHGQSMEGNK